MKSTATSIITKPEQYTPEWFVVDATEMVVGRLASKIAEVLMGKHKPTYTPHVDTGDYVIVLNAEKVTFSGGGMSHPRYKYYTTKFDKKKYITHSLWPGGLKVRSAIEVWDRKPTHILEVAVRRMLPKNPLGRHMLDKLKLFVGTDHPHQAQCPKPMPECWLPR